jgi:hypothetical protein
MEKTSSIHYLRVKMLCDVIVITVTSDVMAVTPISEFLNMSGFDFRQRHLFSASAPRSALGPPSHLYEYWG